jgi:acetoin utilization deacetylase AcuC-like enzyme
MQQQDRCSSTGLGFLLDERYCLHNPGDRHPESPHRIIALKQMIDSGGFAERWNAIQPRSATMSELQTVHSPEYIRHIELATAHAPFHFDIDTVVSSDSYKTALLAAGGTLQCIDSLCLGTLRRVFAFIRPPGHHAERGHAQGFCLFNNVALAAAYARTNYRLERIAIVDTDVHHGNGTQAIFYNDPQTLYISSHQFPFYPGSGNFDEIGTGQGAGYTLNFPLPEGTGDSTFMPIYSKIISSVLHQFSPQLILVSAGFDGHFRDPLGGLTLTAAGYGSAAASLINAADRECAGRICFVLEGGYSMQALQECAQATLIEMEKQTPLEQPSRESQLFREISRQAAKFARGLWKW